MILNSLRAIFFDNAISTQLFLFLSISVSLWLMEMLIAGKPWRKKLQHTTINYGFVLTALPIQVSLAIVMLQIANWASNHHWGLVYLIPGNANIIVHYIAGFLLMDLCDYGYHFVMHNYAPFWRIHLVHHCDPVVDVSTTVREHPCETAIRMIILCAGVFVTGASCGVLIVRQTVGSVANILSHTSISIPPRLERALGWIFITPNLHHTHHHHRLPYTNSNYGDVLSIWDRMFGTYQSLTTAERIYGVDTHPQVAEDTSFMEILKLPFEGRDHALLESTSNHPLS